MFGIAILIGILEGLTEFIPVSSTGHMIIAGHLMGFTGPRADAFEIFIQLGAILAVIGLYYRRFFALIPGRASDGFGGWKGLGLLALTTGPALIAGKLGHHYIKEHLFSPLTVAVGLAVGGVGLILVEMIRPRTVRSGLASLGWKDAIVVGLFQCLSLWPGMSRSGSTIIGGMLGGLDRKTTAEYSFLAAVPIMFAATGYDLYKSRAFLSAADAPLFAVGFFVALVSAWFAIRFFIGFLATHTLKGFGYYRLVLAAVVWWYFSRLY
jgi:undecaprenyl-diphosphatase